MIKLIATDGVAHTATAVESIYGSAAVRSAIPIPVMGTVAGAVAVYVFGGVVNIIYDELTHGDWDLDNFSL